MIVWNKTPDKSIVSECGTFTIVPKSGRFTLYRNGEKYCRGSLTVCKVLADTSAKYEGPWRPIEQKDEDTPTPPEEVVEAELSRFEQDLAYDEMCRDAEAGNLAALESYIPATLPINKWVNYWGEEKDPCAPAVPRGRAGARFYRARLLTAPLRGA